MAIGRPHLSPSWTLPVAGLLIVAGGCARPQGQDELLLRRAERAVADLERLQPRMAKAGTPGGEALADDLASLREALATLPATAPVAPVEAPAPAAPPVPPAPGLPALVRCPDEGCWRLGAQAELAWWRVGLRGGGSTVDDVGPAALGLAIGLERAIPIDHRLEWSWGAEVAAMRQQRDGGQGITLIGLRPVLRASFAVHDAVAITVRPVVEVGQSVVRLGAAPAGVLDRSDAYAALGARLGLRLRLKSGGELTAEGGWRSAWFNASAGAIDYRVTIESAEAAIGWQGRF